KYGNALLTPLAAPRDVPTPVASKPVTNSTPADANSANGTNGSDAVAPEPKKTIMMRLGNISATALHDFVDITVFLILGAMLAAVAKQQIGADRIDALSREQPVLAIPLMMFMAIIMCLCSEADAFVAASFSNM